jgi:hypothetical protein
MAEQDKDEATPPPASGDHEPPRVSVKTVGGAAKRFDEGLTKGLAAGVGGMFRLFSNRLRRALQSGYWQNYAFVVFAALIFAAAALVLFMRFWR